MSQDVKNIFYKLAVQKKEGECPLSAELTSKIRTDVWRVMASFGAKRNLDEVACDQPFLLTAIGEALCIIGDLEYRIFTSKTEAFANKVS